MQATSMLQRQVDTITPNSSAPARETMHEPQAQRRRTEDDKATGGLSLLAMYDEILEENALRHREEERPTKPSTTVQVLGYLSEPPIPRDQDPLHYLASNCARYPDLAIAARTYLSAPPTSVDSERLFSAASDVVDDKRSRILCEKAEMLLFVKMTFAFVKKKMLIPPQ
ncbi:hypothetical protein ACEWY4_016157 [Coilia grayii]